ncbi:MAG: glucose-6-phosphate dehydrogenase [Myxococcales bacterium]|nr:glucose-6-phosphate dehydrogenase [Myxococcota bacterium]MDW8282757.1 glucose-6-phosphate dehydrogenase [Myxococcales bacterium]
MTTTQDNPLLQGLLGERRPEPCAMVIFGASGDLTRRKLVPALYTLASERKLPAGFAIVGMARRDIPFVEQMHQAVARHARRRPIDSELWQGFAAGLSYIPGAFDDPAAYERLRAHLARIDQERGTRGNRVFYISTPPESFVDIITHLGRAGMISAGNEPFTRVIIEKPFGRDLQSAQALNDTCLSVLREEQIYRIDHYLGKETVQNILVFRFANGIFEPLWNNRYIDNVQLTVAESIGIEGRGSYYDRAGTLRDMVQNHMFQLLALMAMEPPVAFEPDAVRDEKVKVLRALRELPLDEIERWTVRGQYGPGYDQGQAVPGYREEPGVSPSSLTETYVALKLYIDNWRWGGVPIYVRAGKRMPKRVSEIAITFKSVPHALLAQGGRLSQEPNVLALRIQPDEGITLKFLSKTPGPTMDPRPVTMDFRYGTSFGAEPPEAYERLLLDCMLGDSTLFTRGDEVLASWRFCTRVLQGWAQADERRRGPLPQYEAGTWGPKEAAELLARDGRAWRRP